MQRKGLMAIGLGVLALVACTGTTAADGRKGTKATAATAAAPKAGHTRKHKTRVRGYLALRGGYYSYDRSDVIGPSYPWLGLRSQSPGGPFDTDFFFDSGVAPLNNAPYPR